mmetsp:Transcript_31542/g.96537  ORF Transcript_31542/g.96537 Transcript_31542/m.96537 type:complete len:202 (-) Transcript_31542:410-1015(-)
MKELTNWLQYPKPLPGPNKIESDPGRAGRTSMSNLQIGEAVAGERRLGDDARERHHGEAAVGDLLLQHRLRLLRGVNHFERVHAEVARPPVGLAGHHLVDGVVRKGLNNANGAEEEEHLSRLHSGVVRSKRGDVRGERNVEAVVNSDVAHPREHANAAVLQLSLAHPVDIKGSGKVERVKTLIRGGRGKRDERSSMSIVAN